MKGIDYKYITVYLNTTLVVCHVMNGTLTSPSSDVEELSNIDASLLMQPDRYGSELPHEKMGVARSFSASDKPERERSTRSY